MPKQPGRRLGRATDIPIKIVQNKNLFMYLNIDEVESALVVATSAPYDGFTQLITLPNKTWEGRTCHAIKIANGNNPNRPGVFFLGGLHAREWGSPDILINFIEQL